MIVVFLIAAACWGIAVWQWFIAAKSLRAAAFWQRKYLEQWELAHNALTLNDQVLGVNDALIAAITPPSEPTH